DLLVPVHEGLYHGLEIHRLAQGQIRPTRLGQVLDLVRALVGCHCVCDQLQVLFQGSSRSPRDHSSQPQSSGPSLVEGVRTLADLVSLRRWHLWLLIHVATACTVTLPHPGRLPRSLSKASTTGRDVFRPLPLRIPTTPVLSPISSTGQSG